MSIVKVKRLRLTGMQAEWESLLWLLQHMGCVETDEPPYPGDNPEWVALMRPDPGVLNAAQDARSRMEGALRTLKKYGPKQKGGLLKSRPVVTEGELFDDAAHEAGLADAGRLGELEWQITVLYAEQNKLCTQRLALTPWLALDIPLETASILEVAVSFDTVAASTGLDALERELTEKSGLTQMLRAGADTQLQCLMFLCHRSAEEACQEVLKEHGLSRTALRGWTGAAAENNKRLEVGQAEAARTLEKAIVAVAGFAPRRTALELCLDRAVQGIAREEAKSRLLGSGTTFYLDGWMPMPGEEKLLRKLGEFACCQETSDPAPEDYPVVPVKLKSNAVTELLTTITKMYSLPAYDGADPNGLMVPFYIFFFGFMFAGLGCGLLLAGACLFIQRKVRPKGGFGQLIRLMTMCGASSAVIGLLTGGFFSDFLVQFTGTLSLPQPAVPPLSMPEGSGLPAPLLNVMEDPMTALVFALAVGFVQIVMGMTVKFWTLCRDGQVWDAVWDVGTWWVILASIGLFALSLTGVSPMGSVAGIPVVLVLGCLMLLAQGRSTKGFGKVTAVIGAVYNGVTGYFGSILSCSRLMVMMLTGSAIRQVFSILGITSGGGPPSAVGIPILFVIFIVGHAFNIGLNVIGTYVHTSRLQYLEFFKQFHREGGRPWRPLNIVTKFVDIKEEQ